MIETRAEETTDLDLIEATITNEVVMAVTEDKMGVIGVEVASEAVKIEIMTTAEEATDLEITTVVGATEVVEGDPVVTAEEVALEGAISQAVPPNQLFQLVNQFLSESTSSSLELLTTKVPPKSTGTN